MKMVLKMFFFLVKDWVFKVFIIFFKLEIDFFIVIDRVRNVLEIYRY